MAPSAETSQAPAAEPVRSRKRTVLFAAKLVFSVAMLGVILWKVVEREGSAALSEHLSRLQWGWVVLAVGMQLCAVATSTERWRLLLRGQGIEGRLGFLLRSFLIGRFFGAFTPGGFTGLGGWRIYDIASRTGQGTRATATIAFEMVLGQLAFALVVALACVWGRDFIGVEGVVLVLSAMASVVVFGLFFLSKPGAFLFTLAWLPGVLRKRLTTLTAAMRAYEGRAGLVARAFGLGVATHAFNNLIYVCAARALGVELTVGQVFFASSLQIMATLAPISLGGVGLREATALALYTRLGIPASLAVLIPIVGFGAEMLVSASGGLFFLLRKRETPSGALAFREPSAAGADAASPRRPAALWAQIGLLAVVLAAVEAAAIVAFAPATTPAGVIRLLFYALAVYVPVATLVSLIFAGVLRFVGPRVGLALAGQRKVAWLVATPLLLAPPLAFRLRRDLFAEAFGWASPQALALLGGCAALALLVALATQPLAVALSRIHSRPLQWGTLAALLGVCLIGVAALPTDAQEDLRAWQQSKASAARAEAAPGMPSRPNVLVVIVDTLRADHLPAYGYRKGSTPALDALTEDAVRFEQAFANASWTRPSFASFLTGTRPAFHGVMSKAAALPSEMTTLAEAFSGAGYRTGSVMTNFNVSSYFRFDQGFDDFLFLEPKYPLGAGENEAKVLPYQVLRRVVERGWALADYHPEESAYRDAAVVSDAALAWLAQQSKTQPWLMVLGYMDPHDPYYARPYTGKAISRAANPNPPAEAAARMRELYDQEITYWDSHFGRVLAGLKAQGTLDDTLIVVTSDHGEEFQEHGGYWHGTTLYDEQLHVPLIVKLPRGDRAGTRIGHWVESIDLMPTLLSYLGLPIPEQVQGGSLFEGKREALAEEDHQGNRLRALRVMDGTEEHKLIEANPGNPRGLAAVELYRLDTDPGEEENLAGAEAPRAQALADRLETRLAQAREGKREAVEVDLAESDEAKARLKALGYLVD